MQRDFVIQIRPEADVRGGQFEGRVEHIYSGRSAHFRTLEELAAFVVRAITVDPTCAAESGEPQRI